MSSNLSLPSGEAGSTLAQVLKGLDKIEDRLLLLPELADRILTLEQKGPSRQMPANSGEAWQGEELSGYKVMRNPKDYRAHYKARMDGSDGSEHVSLADFVRGVAGMKTTAAVTKALSVGTNTAGGYAVPTVTMPEILEAMYAQSTLLPAGAGVVDVDGGKSFTTAAVDALPSAAWRAEGGAVAESDATFRAVSALPQSLSFRFKVSRELLADAPNMNAALELVIGAAFAKEIDRAGLRGSGTAPEVRGILNTTNVQAVANGANGTALASYANFFSAIQAILQADGPMPTTAIMSPRSLVKLGGLLDSTGQPIVRPAMLQSMQFTATSQIPNNLTVGTSTDCSEIYLGEFSRMKFVLRERPSIQLLSELYAESGQVGFACHARVDVAIDYPKAFAVVTGVRA